MMCSIFITDDDGISWVIYHNSDWTGLVTMRAVSAPADVNGWEGEITVPAALIKNLVHKFAYHQIIAKIEPSVMSALNKIFTAVKEDIQPVGDKK